MHPGGPPIVVHRRAGREDLDAARAVNRELVKRVWRFTRSYRRRILVFLLVITLGAILGILPPLLFKRIIDHAIPHRDKGEVTFLAILTMVVALGTVALDLAQRWYSA